MKNLVLVTLMCTALLIANAWVLALPVKAADCAAKCGTNGLVLCSGYACTSQDGVGCTAWDNRGREIIRMPCSGV